mmetsp:Transcript_1567/g.2804  ORF Transcript_1567/g.2804 Transcript_1567/m.2804 type:complete len:256 (-) Transcript_1567:1309-2076(-)
MNSPKQIRSLNKHIPRQKTTVTPTSTSQRFRSTNVGSHEMLAHCNKILVTLVSIFLERGLMPLGSVLASSSNICLDVHASLFQPAYSDGGGVPWSEGDFESAVSVEESGIGAVEFNSLLRYHEIWYFCTILASSKMLRYLQVRGVVHIRKGFQLLHDVIASFVSALTSIREVQRTRFGVTARRQPKQIALLRIDSARARRSNRPSLVSANQFERTSALADFVEFQLLLDVVEHVQDQIVFGRAVPGVGCGIGWFE